MTPTISRGLRAPRAPAQLKEKPTCSIPYVPVVSSRISRILRGVGVTVAMRPRSTLRSLLVRKRPEQAKVLGNVYRLDCSSCPWTYVGETGRPLPDRLKEHRRSWRELDVQRSEVARHSAETGHAPNFQEARVLEGGPVDSEARLL